MSVPKYVVDQYGLTYEVVESKSMKIIKTTENIEDAYELCSQLNSGSGFDGETPAFFFIEAKRPVFAEHEH